VYITSLRMFMKFQSSCLLTDRIINFGCNSVILVFGTRSFMQF